MKNKTLEFLKILLDYFDKHKIQARIFIINSGISLILFSIILGLYVGGAIYDSIITFNCREL